LTALPETPSPTPSKRNLAAFGVMLVIFLFAVDATIVSTAMPTIVANLGGLELYSWVFSIYMLTSALTTPLFGKLSDLYSQRRLMLIGIAIFIFGSTLCGLAPSMEALVLFRAIQGLGGGAIYALSFIVVGILYSPAQRAEHRPAHRLILRSCNECSRHRRRFQRDARTPLGIAGGVSVSRDRFGSH